MYVPTGRFSMTTGAVPGSVLSDGDTVAVPRCTRTVTSKSSCTRA
jgi:hypothetical protein